MWRTPSRQYSIHIHPIKSTLRHAVPSAICACGTMCRWSDGIVPMKLEEVGRRFPLIRLRVSWVQMSSSSRITKCSWVARSRSHVRS